MAELTNSNHDRKGLKDMSVIVNDFSVVMDVDAHGPNHYSAFLALLLMACNELFKGEIENVVGPINEEDVVMSDSFVSQKGQC